MTAPVTTAALADLADLEGYLGHPVDPVQGQAALDAASGWVRAICGWSVSLEVGVTFTADGTDTWVVDLPTLWLVDVHQVRLAGNPLINDPDDGAGYEWSRAGQLFRRDLWPAYPRIIEADVSHGYDPVPPAIVGVVCGVAGRQMDNPAGVRMDTVGTVIRQFHDPGAYAQATSAHMAVLDMYRLPGKP